MVSVTSTISLAGRPRSRVIPIAMATTPTAGMLRPSTPASTSRRKAKLAQALARRGWQACCPASSAAAAFSARSVWARCGPARQESRSWRTFVPSPTGRLGCQVARIRLAHDRPPKSVGKLYTRSRAMFIFPLFNALNWEAIKPGAFCALVFSSARVDDKLILEAIVGPGNRCEECRNLLGEK